MKRLFLRVSPSPFSQGKSNRYNSLSASEFECLHEDAHEILYQLYLDPHCALESREIVQEDLQVPSEKRRGDQTKAVPTGKGASVVQKHTRKTRLEKAWIKSV